MTHVLRPALPERPVPDHPRPRSRPRPRPRSRPVRGNASAYLVRIGQGHQPTREIRTMTDRRATARCLPPLLRPLRRRRAARRCQPRRADEPRRWRPRASAARVKRINDYIRQCRRRSDGRGRPCSRSDPRHHGRPMSSHKDGRLFLQFLALLRAAAAPALGGPPCRPAGILPPGTVLRPPGSRCRVATTPTDAVVSRWRAIQGLTGVAMVRAGAAFVLPSEARETAGRTVFEREDGQGEERFVSKRAVHASGCASPGAASSPLPIPRLQARAATTVPLLLLWAS